METPRSGHALRTARNGGKTETMKRTAAILLGLLVLIITTAAVCADAADRPDRQIVFEENRVIAGIRGIVFRKPGIERLSEDAPAKTKLVWQSSNPTVAAVSNWGQVTALTPGGTLITAQAEDNPEIKGSYELYVVWPVEEMIPEEPDIILTMDAAGTKDETDLFYTYRPSDAWMGGVRWYSSDESVAAVDENGHVKAAAPGNAVITAEAVLPAGLDGAAKALFRIRVVREAETLTLSEETLELRRFRTRILKADISPADATDRKVIWSSSDPSVAQVTGGRVKGVSSGSCDIRCSSDDGRLNASCRVTVFWPTQYVRLSERNVTMSPEEKIQIRTTVYPADADNTDVVWSSSDARIASVDSEGTVTAALGGDCVITCAPADGVGDSAQCRIHVKPFSIVQKEWTADRKEGVTIPVRWHSLEPVALELKPNTACFRAVWDNEDNIFIQPLSAGSGILTVQPEGAEKDRVELRIVITENAVTNTESYTRFTYEGLIKDEPEIGSSGKILGRVLQRIEQQDMTVMLVGTAGEDWDREIFWVEHDNATPVTSPAKGDLVIVYGTYAGVYTYETAASTDKSVPAMKAREIVIR